MEHTWNIHFVLRVTVLLFYVEDVSTNAAIYRAETGTDVTIRCSSTKLPPQQNRSTITVEWNREDVRGHRHTVYTLVDGRVDVTRPGAEVDLKGLLQSDASLSLRNVTVGDEGLYTCRVITSVVMTPQVYSLVDTATASLEVLARPEVWLPEKASIARGEEKMIVCDIRGYYPSKLTVTWLLNNGSHAHQARASHQYRVCTEMAVHNDDGTYSIRSGITVQASVLEHGLIQLVCRVEHQIFPKPFTISMTLTQEISGRFDAVELMVGSSVASVLLVLTAVGAVLLLLRYSRRKAAWHVPPIVSEISQPNITYADVETVLKCLIAGVGLGEFRVHWWRLSGTTADSEEVSLLHWDDLSAHASLESNGSHHTSALSLCLSTGEDGSRYRCEVHWNGATITRETTVHLKVEPSFLQISSIPQIPQVQRLLVLCCRVEHFYPPDICLEWSRSDGEAVQPPTHYGPFSDHGRLFSVWSKIQLTMATEDESAVFTCRVYHSSLTAPGYKDILYHINTQGTPPDVMFIDCEPLCPVLNTECTLQLCIKDFSPEHVTATWTVDGDAVDNSFVFNTPPSLNINGLYSMYSFLRVRPSAAQCSCCYRCKVEHSAQSQAEERSFTLTPSPQTAPLS